MDKTDIQSFYKQVIDYAESRIGFRELQGNSGFEEKIFENELKQVQWQSGWAWCMSFAERCWIAPASYRGKSIYFKAIQQLLIPSATGSYNNIRKDKSGLFVVDQTPVVGGIVIWQKQIKGKAHWTGHAGICSKVTDTGFEAIEGNTNDSGGREGIEVAVMKGFKRHALPPVKIENGLQFLGCIKIAET